MTEALELLLATTEQAQAIIQSERREDGSSAVDGVLVRLAGLRSELESLLGVGRESRT